MGDRKEEKFNFSKTVSADCILFLIVSMLLSDEFLGYSQKYEVPQQLSLYFLFSIMTALTTCNS